MNNQILNQLIDSLCKFSKKMDFSKPIIRSDRYSTEIYILKEHALQLEIDWRENNLYMYVVYLKNKELPDESVIYRYSDGHWCRKYLEEIYNVKHPLTKDKTRRYSPQYLFDCFDFYMQLICRNPAVLEEFL